MRSPGGGPARRAFLVLIPAALVACAGLPASPPSAIEPLPDATFEVSGRLSARRGSEGAAVGFRWTHRPEHDELVLTTPLGAALAQLQGDAREVSMTLADGRTERASDWQALTARVLGAPVPVRGLAWWVRGSPHPFGAHTAERDAQSRPSVLAQDGWTIVFEYGGEADDRPARLRLAYPDTEVRLVLDEWSEPAP